jgi:methyl-accepting chemotaxis protein
MARDLTSRLKAAAHAVELLRARLAAHGPIRRIADDLFAGDKRLNGDEQIVDEVYDATLFGTTIFLGGVRIATRAVEVGSTERALGTMAAEEVIEMVFVRGETFTGATETLGRRYAIVYEPLEDADGQRIGMLAGYRELVG